MPIILHNGIKPSIIICNVDTKCIIHSKLIVVFLHCPLPLVYKPTTLGVIVRVAMQDMV
jgi:hypothetical protein